MRDFTKASYNELLNELKKAQYKFVAFEEYLKKTEKKEKTIIMRHDVDKKPARALEMAQKEKELGIRGTYYFRVKKGVVSEDEIRKIMELGHEIGYHYEDLDVARGDVEAALGSFKRNLERLREIVLVKTICMHGSPLSRFDNRTMWQDHDCRSHGIIGEPYFNVDFNEVMYLTDTGRRWDGGGVSIRDKVRGEGLEVRGQKSEDRKQKTDDRTGEAKKRPKTHSTNDLIKSIRNNQLPDQIMLTIHPQRWTDEWGPWLWELVSQKVKNIVKYFIVRYRRAQVGGDG